MIPAATALTGAARVRHTRDVVQRFTSFVGRDDELAALTAALEDAGEGRGSVWLLTGEPGIGKSRLSEEVARRASDSGFGVVWGRCWEAGGAPAFWPWIQALRALCRTRGDRALSLPTRHQLAPLLPELAGDATPASATGNDRFVLLDAMTTAICDFAANGPLLIVLDDLHAADHSSLALLDFASRQLYTSPVVVLGTYRGRDAQHSEHAALINRIAHTANTIPLGPLDATALGAYLRDAAGDAGTDALAAALHARTEGNPLFMVELVRLIASDPSMTAETVEQINLPPGLEQALRAHVDALSPGSRRVVDMAAVMGRELGAEALARHFELPFDDVRAALDEAVGLGLLQAIGADNYRFSHILVRDAVEREAGESARGRLHRRLAESLAASHDRTTAPWSEIAHHFEVAGPACRPQTIAALARAGEAATAAFAFEDAASAYRRALRLLDAGGDDPRQRAELSIGLCRVLVRAGKRDDGRDSCRAAAAVARDLNDAELLARAALELGSMLVFAHVDPELVSLLREALDALPSGDSSLRALVQARLAAAMQPAPNPDEPMALAIDAIDMARRVGDRATLLAALRTGCSAMVDLVSPEVRLELDREHAMLAEAAGERHDALRAQTRLIFDYFETGNRLGADAAVRAATALIQSIDHPIVNWRLHAMDAMRALWDGALEAALESSNRARDIGVSSGDPNAWATTLYQRQRILRMLGRVDELMAGVEDMRGLFRGTPTMELYVSVTIAGHVCEARGADEAMRGLPPGALRDVLDLGDRTILEPVAELALASGDEVAAEAIRARLAQVPDQLVAGGVIGMTWDTPVHRILALCARILGDTDAAIDHFERGIALARRLGGDPVAARMTIELGELLASVGRADDARPLLAAGAAEATTLAMALLADRANAALDALAPAAPTAPSPARPTAEPHDAFSFEPEGDVWLVRHGGAEFRIKDSKGIQFLATLVAQPHQDVHVLDLAAPAARREVDGDGGEMLDATARDAYKERIRTLRAELDQAEEWNDSGRAEAARAELDMLTQELSRGLGLGGKSRKFGSNAERARVNVQRRIRDAIRRIATNDEALARHLERSIRTGMHCAYDPE